MATLAALDLVGLFLAIYTALVVKAALRAPEQLDQMWAQANEYFPLAALVMLLLFARSGLYRDRAQRPGFSRVIASLFQVTLVVLIYAEIEGEPFQSYYIFYASLFFALLYVSLLRWGFERVSGVVLRAAGYRRRAVLVGSGSNIQAVSHALRDSNVIEPYGFVARTPVALLDGLRDFRSLEQLERHFDAIDEVLITDADFPQGEAVELVDRCHQPRRARARGALDDGDPDGSRRSSCRARRCRCSSSSRRCSTASTSPSSAASTSSGAALLLLALAPLMALAALAIKLSSRGPVLLPLDAPGHRRAAVPVPQVPHDGGRGG